MKEHDVNNPDIPKVGIQVENENSESKVVLEPVETENKINSNSTPTRRNTLKNSTTGSAGKTSTSLITTQTKVKTDPAAKKSISKKSKPVKLKNEKKENIKSGDDIQPEIKSEISQAIPVDAKIDSDQNMSVSKSVDKKNMVKNAIKKEKKKVKKSEAKVGKLEKEIKKSPKNKRKGLKRRLENAIKNLKTNKKKLKKAKTI